MSVAGRQSLFTPTSAADALSNGALNNLGLAAPQAGNDTLDAQDWACVRAQFNLSPDVIHLSNFFLASSPLPVRQALSRHRQAFEQNPYSYLEDNMFGQADAAAWRKVCEAAAQYIGGQPQEVALTTSTTQGLAMIYNGLTLKADDEILTTTHEWYTHDEAMRLAVLKGGGSIRRIDLYTQRAEATADRMVEQLRAAIRLETRIVAMTWVHSGTGVRLPIRAMADVIAQANQQRSEQDRILLVVDGVHGFGCVDEDVASLGCDFFSAGTHKWILGPHGTGLVWASEENWTRIIPTIPTIMSGETMEAWRQVRAPHGPTQAAWVSPGGFLAFENQWATLEAFQFIEKIGRTRIAHRVAELNGQLKEGLARMPHVTLHTPLEAELSAGIVCCDIKGRTPVEVVKALKRQNIIINATPYRHSTARFSAGIVNSPADIDTTLEAVRALG
ncbi:aminotransferase class V-fold PLP-dependent enzyme [Xanthomonas sp. WHRI 1810A]|uniref:aminotransferase class V-fold PLP-dependent enzyme n=1 Tax=Xanthomonas sp. WHRI 1810A TaxID=3161565 RepID=UPI0032E92478